MSSNCFQDISETSFNSKRNYLCLFITLLLPQGKISFPIRQKKEQQNAVTPTHFPSFTCPSCFQSPASTCRTLSSCNKIGSCFQTNRRDSRAGGKGCFNGGYWKPVYFSPVKITEFLVLGVLSDHSSFPLLVIAIILPWLPCLAMAVLESRNAWLKSLLKAITNH